MWIYVLEQPITDDDVAINYCSLNDSKLANYAKTNNINGNVNGRFPFFDITGKTVIYSVVVDKNGNWVDVGQYFETQADANLFVRNYSSTYKSPNVKVVTITVL
jgi:hypothetical protein